MHIRLYYTWCILFVILLLPLFLSQSVELATPTYTIISIVDITGLLSCLIKVHSVLKSTKSSTQFGFKFLVLDTANSKGETLQLEKWNEIFQYAFPDVQFESKLWRTPATMPKLRQKDFEKDYIFSRFYLADIFPAVDQYVYLDNDLVVTADLVELFQTPLAVSAFMATSGAPTKPGLLAALPADSTSTHPRSNRPGGTNAVLNQRDQFKTQAYMEEKKRMAQIKEDLKRKPPPGGGFKPCVGFVYERHTDYNRYLEDNFNRSHPKVVETQGLMLSSLFLNGGVALVNASCWRQRKMRQQAEALMVLNTEPGNQMYGTGAGDQAVFYLLLQNRVAYLHARWNMRRLPMKTVHMLSHRQLTGVVHYAGYTHGDAVRFCIAPLHLPIFTHNVVPLYLAVAASYANSIHEFNDKNSTSLSSDDLALLTLPSDNSTSLSSDDLALLTLPSDICNDAVNKLLNHSQYHRDSFPNYSPGIFIGFKFPPESPFP